MLAVGLRDKQDAAVPAGSPRRDWRALLRGLRVPLAIAVVTTFLVCRGSPLLSSLEFPLLDLWTISRPARQPDPRIALVGFEQGDVEHYRNARSELCTCGPIPRTELAAVVRRIKGAGARVVVLDLILDSECPVAGHNGPLAEALSLPGETILAAPSTSNPDKVFFEKPAERFLGPPERPHILSSPVLYTPAGIVRGINLVQTGVPSEAAANQLAPLELLGTALPPLSVAAWCAWEGKPWEIPVATGPTTVDCMDATIPVWPSASIYLLPPIAHGPDNSLRAMMMNWAGPIGTFPMYRFSAIPYATSQELERWFANCIVLVGSAVERQHTPPLGRSRSAGPGMVDQSHEVAMTGLEIHANALDTLLQRRFLRPLPPAVNWLVIFALTLTTALAFRVLRTYAAVAVALLEIALLVPAAMLLFRLDMWLYTALPALGVLASGISTAVWSYARTVQRADSLQSEVAAREAATETIVHDLKQPLSAISAMAQLLRARQQTGGLEGIDPELSARMLRQVEAALSDIDDLLTASPDRVLVVNPREFDVVALARDLAVAQSMKSEIHDVVVGGPEEGLVIEADPRLIGRALSNLIDNAIKYWPEGGTVRVEIDTVSGHAIILVLDEGLGMTPQQQERCFGRFQRAVPEHLGIPGTGIGLYSVRRIAQAHGGRVEVISAPGKGSTFILTLPLEQSAEDRAQEVRFA